MKVFSAMPTLSISKRFAPIFLLLFLPLVGCKDENVIRQNNEKTLSQKGDVIGVLPNGKEVMRYRIEMIGHDHWVYVVNDVITVNDIVDDGDDNTHNQVEIIINGIKYNAEREE